MKNNEKDYFVKSVERSSEVNKDLNRKIRNNVIFAVAAFLLAGVAFGIGGTLFGSTTLQNIVAFGSVGVSCANIRAAKENIKLKSGKASSEQPKQYSRGSK